MPVSMNQQHPESVPPRWPLSARWCSLARARAVLRAIVAALLAAGLVATASARPPLAPPPTPSPAPEVGPPNPNENPSRGSWRSLSPGQREAIRRLSREQRGAMDRAPGGRPGGAGAPGARLTPSERRELRALIREEHERRGLGRPGSGKRP